MSLPLSRKLACECASFLPEALTGRAWNSMVVAKRDLKRVERAARKADDAREELRHAIEQARAAGETLDDIGRAAGLSRQRISQILQERR